ncbi:hypothetical protein L1987_26469 [Smallanthus sonchifolius]|uniref:Uncharacterized protein n=1 Tax=Smallanthus sonchifolius TaxID=185202 RepID=A0ACB9IB59_9ASTR|nr:hypothetical protein L1987_26469 [Smallanthus sonchifolius]
MKCLLETSRVGMRLSLGWLKGTVRKKLYNSSQRWRGSAPPGCLRSQDCQALGWVFRSVKRGELQRGLESVTGKLLESGENVKNTGKEWAGHLKQTEENLPENVTANRA